MGRRFEACENALKVGLRVGVLMGRVNGEECGVSSSMGAYVFARSCVREGERGDFIGQLLQSC
jgi:hypothetical protein